VPSILNSRKLKSLKNCADKALAVHKVMESFNLWHWIILILLLVLNGVPIAKILGRVGLSKWWTIAFLVPFLNLVALWIFANARWPAIDRTTR